MDGAPVDGVPAADAAAPTCYRHPHREANVRCTRCERPVCPQCMVSASVGFQCPECIRGGQQGGRAARTAFGGRIASNTALVTKILIGVNFAVFLAVNTAFPWLIIVLELVGLGSYQGELIGVAEGPGQWYRLLTAVFLHQQIMHVALNMLSLWWLGPQLEAALGRVRYLAVYLLSGLGGAAFSFLVAPPGQQSLGASGAIFGLLGATLVLVRRLGYDMRPIVILIVLNLVFTFAWANIDWRAHVGGLAFGSGIAFGMVHAPRERRALVQGLTCVTAFAVIAAMVWAGTVRITG